MIRTESPAPTCALPNQRILMVYLSFFLLCILCRYKQGADLLSYHISNFFSWNADKEKTDGETAQSTSSETDLAVVLNAWYSAGFYTGK